MEGTVGLNSVFRMLPVATKLAQKIQGLFYLCKGETSQQQGSEGWAGCSGARACCQ